MVRENHRFKGLEALLFLKCSLFLFLSNLVNLKKV
ncbi:hypothetical protein SAMN06269250_5059 [Spirosoma fluviale]|uniref:Uncharacterized protein n=1 Tax=Spirosoma fluviale TaxID=1597977 RepID=A0A286GLG3_9BACT|nr:hypothetical protein SAMN06269250_5059 [Spirosoma fluviale]